MHRLTAFVPTPPLARVGGIAAAVLLAGGALVACSGSGGSGASTSAAGTPAAPTTTVTSTPAAPTTSPAGSGQGQGQGQAGGGPTVSQGGTLSACAESQLKAAIDPRPVGGTSSAGDYAVIVDFTNTSSTSCTITGYPGAALVNDDGKQVTQATRTIRGALLGLPTGQNALPTTTLKPGAVASAGLEGVNQKEEGAAQAGCDEHYPRILVTPPNTKTAVPFTVSWPVCYSFTVHPTNIEKNPPSH